MIPKSLYWFPLLALTATIQPHVARAQGEGSGLSPEEDRRRALYQEGKEAIRAQRWLDAKSKLSRAWAIRPSYDVALSLSQAEFNTAHYAESAHYLAYYFRNVSAKENENNLENARQAFAAAKAKVGSVQITAPNGAELSMDGKVVGRAPLDTDVFVEPGRHVFEARLAGAQSQQVVQVMAGQEQQLALELERPLAPQPPSVIVPTPHVEVGLPEQANSIAPAPASDRTFVPAYVGAGIAVVGLGVGMGFALAASRDRDDIEALKRRNGDSGCKDGSARPSDCAAQADAVEARDRHLTYEVVGFSLAGAAAVGTLTYLLWPQPSAVSGATSKALRWGAAPSTNGGGVWLSGKF